MQPPPLPSVSGFRVQYSTPGEPVGDDDSRPEREFTVSALKSLGQARRQMEDFVRWVFDHPAGFVHAVHMRMETGHYVGIPRGCWLSGPQEDFLWRIMIVWRDKAAQFTCFLDMEEPMPGRDVRLQYMAAKAMIDDMASKGFSNFSIWGHDGQDWRVLSMAPERTAFLLDDQPR